MKNRIISGVAVAALVLGSVVTLGIVSASGAASATVTVTPDSGLVALQSVTVTGSGFPDSASLAIVECIASAATLNDCGVQQGYYKLITSNADGTIPATSFFVQTGPIGTGSGTCGTSAADASCLIVIGSVATETLLGEATITFDTSGTTTTTTTTPGGTTTTTTTPPTTTTTSPPAPKSPHATKISGAAVPGKTVTLTISGTNFAGKPKITGHAGTTVTVVSATKTKLTVKVKEAANGKKGTYVLSIRFPNGKKTSVKYSVK